MRVCPNCNAELSARPCSACGWPESTRLPPEPWWRRWFGSSRSAPEPSLFDEDTTRGCLFGLVVHLLLGACLAGGIGYAIAGERGAALGALLGGVAGLKVWWDDA
ncbi:MAG: hypothetical protein KDD82_24880 [Planctomycetes bacterium]|nr:hypothetical protein [Planctomycetota bacterium]